MTRIFESYWQGYLKSLLPMDEAAVEQLRKAYYLGAINMRQLRTFGRAGAEGDPKVSEAFMLDLDAELDDFLEQEKRDGME